MFEDYLTYLLAEKRYSPLTVRAYGDDIRQFALFCLRAGDPETGSAEDSGSEALWEILKHRGAPSRVLFLRGQTGREWLPEQLRSIGSDVITMCIYVRVPLELTPEQRSDILMAAHGPSPIIYITSTDAVDALFHAIRPVSEVRDWVTNGVAVTLHPRIVRRLQEAGFHHIEVTCTDDEVVASHIRANLP